MIADGDGGIIHVVPTPQVGKGEENDDGLSLTALTSPQTLLPALS